MYNLYIFDLDGTLADCEWRRFMVTGKEKDFDAFNKACAYDKPHKRIINMAKGLLKHGHGVIIFSGRSDIARIETIKWLSKYGLANVPLIMRRKGDYTPDELLKERWLNELPYKPFQVFDDRSKVVAMWRKKGIACLQVANGDF